MQKALGADFLRIDIFPNGGAPLISEAATAGKFHNTKPSTQLHTNSCPRIAGFDRDGMVWPRKSEVGRSGCLVAGDAPRSVDQWLCIVCRHVSRIE